MNQKKAALLVAINEYENAPLSYCVRDAQSMEPLLAKHANGDPNFECKLITSPGQNITRAFLKQSLEELFSGPRRDLVLFYFSGHGIITNEGGYLVTQDAKAYDEGLGMTEVITMANNSNVAEIIFILDCCHSGA